MLIFSLQSTCKLFIQFILEWRNITNFLKSASSLSISSLDSLLLSCLYRAEKRAVLSRVPEASLNKGLQEKKKSQRHLNSFLSIIIFEQRRPDSLLDYTRLHNICSFLYLFRFWSKCWVYNMSRDHKSKKSSSLEPRETVSQWVLKAHPKFKHTLI